MKKRSFKRPVKSEDFLFVDKEIFGDEEEHSYDVVCYDGWGIATPYYKDEDPVLLMTYPTMEVVLSNEDMVNAIIDYRYYGRDMKPEDLRQDDVAIKYAKLVKLTPNQIKALTNK